MVTPTTSGTTAFNPGAGEFVLYAYGLCGIRRTAITQEHLVDARMAMNLMFSEWNNDTPNLWKVDLVEVPLAQGQATYAVDPSTVMVLDVYIRTPDAAGSPNDINIFPISRSDYASLPNKDMQGRVTSYWYNRQISPSITLWMVPDQSSVYKLRYYRVTSLFDIDMQGGQTLDIPNRWFGAFAWGLAARLAHSYKPSEVARLEAKAGMSLALAQGQDVEDVPMHIGPQLGGYFVR